LYKQTLVNSDAINNLVKTVKYLEFLAKVYSTVTEKFGEQDVLVAAPIILLGEQLLLLLPRFPRLWLEG